MIIVEAQAFNRKVRQEMRKGRKVNLCPVRQDHSGHQQKQECQISSD
jgi:hypothetical protein